jgi:hypothetical protein
MLPTHTSAYVSIRQHTAAYGSIRQHNMSCCEQLTFRRTGRAVRGRLNDTPPCKCTYVLHTSAYVSIRQHTSHFSSVRQHSNERSPQLHVSFANAHMSCDKVA